MKRILTLVLFLVSVQVLAQTNTITGITIVLPANPDANTANWGSGSSMFTITAAAKMVNGRIDGRVQESKILVSIKKGGSKICGIYTSNSAPASNFNTANKVWSGNNAVALVGQDCTLPPGDYELCVQFFGPGPTGIMPLSEEKCRSFSIRNAEVQTYRSPDALSPAHGTILNEAVFNKPITFRWTPVVPRPRESVTYRLKVWQLMQGQNGVQAMKANQPIITKDVDNLTQTTILNLITGPCKPPYLCDFVWNVQALDRDGKPIGGNNGTSEANKIIVQPANDEPSVITLLTPKNGSVLSANDRPKFTWNHDRQHPGPPSTYKIKIVEIKGDQSPEEAFRGNKPFFEKDSLKPLAFQYPSSAPAFEEGRKYGWKIEAGRNPPYGEVKITESEINEFIISRNAVQSSLNLITPANKSTISLKDKPNFTWTFKTTENNYSSGSNQLYKIKIVEIIGDQSPEEAFRGNKPFFEKDSLKPLAFQYPSSATNLEAGKRYAWNVQVLSRDGRPVKASTVSMFAVVGELNLISPSVMCPMTDPRPLFEWNSGRIKKSKTAFYKIRIAEMDIRDSTMEAFDKRKTVAVFDVY